MITSPDSPSSTYTIIKKVWSIALPLTASRLFNVVMSFLGVLFIAHLGHTELAASALITATQIPLFLIASSPLFALSVVAGHAHGAKRYEDIGSILQQGWLLGLIISVIVMIIPLSMKPILLALGQDPVLVTFVKNYFLIYAIGIPGILGLIATQQFFIAIGKQRLVLLLSIVSFILFVSLAPLFIYGAGFVPRLGVPGLALASVLQIWINFIICLIICAKGSDFAIYKIFKWRLFSTFHFMKELWKIGWPISLQMAGDLLSFFIITIIVGWLGKSALAANQIVTQYYILLVVPILAMSQASSVLISQARGATNYALAKRYGNATLLVGSSFAIVVTLLFILFPQSLVKLYLHSHAESVQTMKLASIILIMTGFRLIFDTLLEIKIGNLRGLLDTRWPMLIGLLYTWVCFIPAAYLLGIRLHFGLIGISAASIAVTLLGALTLWFRWQRRCAELIPAVIVSSQREVFS